MKKTISILICVILTMTLTAACAGGDAYRASSSPAWNDSGYGGMATPAPMEAPLPSMPEEAIMYDYAEYEVYNDADGSLMSSVDSGFGVASVSTPATDGLAEKIIYSVYADIETVSFDETIENVNVLLAAYGAFIENSSISGINYAARFHGWTDYRYAYFSIRVPVQNLDAMTDRLNILGNVVNRNSSADNITAQFFDTQSRLNSLTLQEERLLEMLSQANDIPDLIAIEERLSDVRYQIEWLTSMLTNWQRQVDYSNLALSIREVEQFTEPTLIHRTYWQQIGDGFMATIRGVGRFFMNLFMWVIVAAPVLVILAIIGFVIFIIARKKLRAAEAKRKETLAYYAANPPPQGYIPPGYPPPDNPSPPQEQPENKE